MENPPEPVERILDDYLEHRIPRREFFRRAAAVGLSLSAAATLLASCGGDDSEGAATAGDTAGGGTPVVGGVLREGYDRDVVRIDPVNGLWGDPTVWPVTHETLIILDGEGRVSPMLAESWTTSPDGLIWTFKMRSGLRFHGGAPCNGPAAAAALTQISKEGVITGFFGPVQRITAPDASTVVFHLANPYADLPYVLAASGFTSIFNKKTRDQLGERYGQSQVDGTGPFTLKTVVPGSHAEVVRWEEYPGAIGPFFRNKGKAYLDGIRFEVIAEPAARARELEAGNLDALQGPAPQDVDRLQEDPDLAVIEFQEWSQYILGLNFEKTDLGFNDVRVRQAISKAIDRQAIADTIFFGKAVPVYTVVQPAFPWYDASVEAANAFDLDAAKGLLDEAGFGSGLNFEAVVAQDRIQQQVAQAIQEMLGDLGVQMELAVYGSDFFEKASGGADAYVTKNLWPYQIDVSILYMGAENVPPGCCNWSFANIPDLEAGIREWQTAPDVAGLEAASQTIQAVAAEQLPYLPVVTPLKVWAHHNRVKGWVPTQANIYPFYQDVYLET